MLSLSSEDNITIKAKTKAIIAVAYEAIAAPKPSRCSTKLTSGSNLYLNLYIAYPTPLVSATKNIVGNAFFIISIQQLLNPHYC